MVKFLFVVIIVNFFVLASFSGSAQAEGYILPDISIVMYGDLEEVSGLKDHLLESFGKGGKCKTNLTDEGGDFELIIEGRRFKREDLFLAYTLIQPFKSSAVFKIYDLKGSLKNKSREGYVENSRIYLNGWTSVSSARTAEELSEKICQDYYDNLESHVLESLRD